MKLYKYEDKEYYARNKEELARTLTSRFKLTDTPYLIKARITKLPWRWHGAKTCKTKWLIAARKRWIKRS